MWIFKAILASAVLFLAAVKAQEEGKNTVTNIPFKNDRCRFETHLAILVDFVRFSCDELHLISDFAKEAFLGFVQ